MKKRGFILTILAAILTLGLTTSCNKTEKLIIGSWVASNTIMLDNSEEGVALDIDGSIWTFNNDKTCSITDEGETQTGTYTVNDDHLTMTFKNVEMQALTVTFDMDITKKSNTSLTIEGNMTMSVANGREEWNDVTKFRTTLTKK